jgi:hypothetical protein
MPRFDGTGPMGRGPLTGRGMGYCAVRLPSEADTGLSLERPRVSRSRGLSYPSRGPSDSQRVQFAPTLTSFGRLSNRRFQHRRTLHPGSKRFARREA